MLQKMEIPVMLATDDNYVVCACTAITSLMENLTTDTTVASYILVSSSFSEESCCLLKQLEQKYKALKVSLIEMKPEQHQYQFKDTSQPDLITRETYYRLVLGKLFPQIDKCLYLDCDVIVGLDIGELYACELGDHYLAGVRESIIQEEMDRYRDYAGTIGLSTMDDYINAGVLVMNLDRIRRDGLTERFLKHAGRNYRMNDQDVLNICCKGHILYLPLKFNLPKRFYGKTERLEGTVFSEKEIEEASQEKIILHYAEKFKPWTSNRCIGRKEWWNYATLTGCGERLGKMQKRILEEDRRLDAKYLIDLCREKQNIAVFGYSDIGKRACDCLMNNHITPTCFCDNDVGKQGREYRGIKVTGIREALEQYCGLFVVNTSQLYASQINRQLLEAGMQPENIFAYQNKNKLYYRILLPECYLNEMKQLILEEYGMFFSEMSEKEFRKRIRMEDVGRLREKYFLKEWLWREGYENWSGSICL